VFFLGVFYHLIDPIDGLRRAADLAREVLVVETHIEESIEGKDVPSMVFYPDGCANDSTNCWGPNTALIFALLRFGFGKIDLTYGPRAIFHDWR
jgi:tRNA (mo5U34)-methyltransferase